MTGAYRRAGQHALAALLLTSVHHAYGAYVYDTPWRYHVVLVSVPAAVMILGALALLRVHPSWLPWRLTRGLLVLTILAVVLAIGAFEGGYNHAAKNLLYFGGAFPALTARLFPAPTYVMPDNVFFEITGIAQVVPAALAARHLYGTGSRN